jgi:PAS domain-containing protein
VNFNTAIRPEFFASQAAILNTILVTSEYGVLLTDLDHQSIACNPRFGELFGLDIHEVVKSNAGVVREMVQNRIVDLDTWLANLELIYNDPFATQTDELSLVNPVQKLRRTTMPVKDEGGEVVGRLWSFFDVTQITYEQSLRENLYQFSQMVDPDPGHVYREIVERIGSFYDSICLLSLQDGDFLQFRA